LNILITINKNKITTFSDWNTVRQQRRNEYQSNPEEDRCAAGSKLSSGRFHFVKY
jgi:hypothetical protein